MTWKDCQTGAVHEKMVFVREPKDCIPQILRELHPKMRPSDYEK